MSQKSPWHSTVMNNQEYAQFNKHTNYRTRGLQPEAPSNVELRDDVEAAEETGSAGFLERVMHCRSLSAAEEEEGADEEITAYTFDPWLSCFAPEEIEEIDEIEEMEE
jgi:hypothetical protein